MPTTPRKKPPRPPAHPHGLRARGGAFWSEAIASYELSGSELELLVEACRLLDEVEALHDAIEADGLTVAGAAGQTRIHPAVAEVRQHRLALGRVLAQLQLPDDEGATMPTSQRARAQRAAAVRWAGHEKRSS